jgi:hypothetical protein
LKTLQLKIGDNLTQTHGCIDANQEFTRCGNHPNIISFFEGLGRSLSSLRHKARPHLRKNENLKQRGGRGMPPTIALWFYL